MAELSISVDDAVVDPYAAVPTISFVARVAEATGAVIHAIALRAQVRIEPQRRQYSVEEQQALVELFGETPQWGDSLRPFQWTTIDTTVTGFTDESIVTLPMTCTYDFEVAGSKYLHSLTGGELPLVFFFSGTVFVKGGAGFAVEPVPWHLEARYRLPVSTWQAMMDCYFPGSGWLRLSTGTIDGLQRFRVARALPTMDQAIEQLLKEVPE